MQTGPKDEAPGLEHSGNTRHLAYPRQIIISNGLMMKLTFIEPLTELKPYLKSIWVCESPVGLPVSAKSIAAPNGCPKLIINYKNRITSLVAGRASDSREQGIYFSGNRDIPVYVSTPEGKTGFIGIEFLPYGAYPILGIPMIETANHLSTIEDILGKLGRELREELYNLKSIRGKIDFIQTKMVQMLDKRQLQSSIVKYCVDALKLSDGLLAVSELERKTGYSRRYLEMLFKNHVGFSPKVIAEIFRFQIFYGKWAKGRSYDELKEELNNYYFDQAHFSKEFKKMTGFSPLQFTNEVSNEFGRRLTVH